MVLPRVGDALPDLVIDEVRGEPMKVMALLLDDSNVIHFDRDAVARLGLGDQPVNQGPTNLGYVIRMLADWAGGEERIRSISTRFRSNVVAGDSVVAGGRIVELGTEGGASLAHCDVWLDRADGTRVLDGRAVLDVSDA